MGASAALVPSSIIFAEKAKEITQEFFEYSSGKINHINEYAMSAILPSLTSMALFAYTMELFYLALFLFLILSAGITI